MQETHMIIIVDGTIKAFSSMNQLPHRPYLTKAPSSY